MDSIPGQHDQPVPVPSDKIVDYSLTPLADIPLEEINKGGIRLPGFIMMEDDEDKPFFEGGYPIETGVLNLYEDMRTLLNDPIVANEFTGIGKWMSEVDLNSFTAELKDCNNRLTKGEDVYPNEEFMRQAYALNKVLTRFYRETTLKDAGIYLEKAQSQLMRDYDLSAGGLTDKVRAVIEVLKTNPVSLISPLRFGEEGGTVIEAKNPPIQFETKTAFQGDNNSLLEAIRMIRDDLSRHYFRSQESTDPEFGRFMALVIGKILGREDTEKILEEYQSEPQGYCSNHIGAARPSRGLKIHTPFDYREEKSLEMLEVLAQKMLRDNIRMKVQHYTTQFRNDKGITIYPPFDEGIADAEAEQGNFTTAIQTAKELDALLMPYKQARPTPYHTDLPVGTLSNRVSMRYGELKADKGSKKVTGRYGDVEGTKVYPDGWQDSRKKNFQQNFPSKDTYKSFLSTAQEQGLIVG